MDSASWKKIKKDDKLNESISIKDIYSNTKEFKVEDNKKQKK